MNTERRNDLTKRAHHRLVARALSSSQVLLHEAREIVRAWKAEPARATFVDQWEDVLSQDVRKIRRDITSRTSKFTQLRRSSPFALTPTKVLPKEGAARLRTIASRLERTAQ